MEELKKIEREKLFDNLRLFYDKLVSVSEADKPKIKNDIQDYFFRFCIEKNLDVADTFLYLKKRFEDKINDSYSISIYQLFQGDGLGIILFGDAFWLSKHFSPDGQKNFLRQLAIKLIHGINNDKGNSSKPKSRDNNNIR